MRISITTQLFAAMLGLCLLVIFAMGGATIWSLRQGFDNFTRQQDSQRAEAVAATLAELYRQQGSWQLIQQHPRLWYDILSMDDPERSPLGTRGGVPVVPQRLRAHWSLVDPQQQVIAGNLKPSSDAQRFGIVIGGKYVGQLVVSARERAISAGEKRFLEQQRQSGLFIMLLSAVVALIAALLLARRFLAPIRQLADGTNHLTAGQYDIQIPAHRKDEFGQLAHDFNGLARTLSQNEKLRRDFVADISHELRTPLAILTGEIEAIEDGIRPATAESIGSLKNEVHALTRLVDDLYQLALSDVGGLRYNMRTIDLRQPILALVPAYTERLAAQGLAFHHQLPEQAVMLQADYERMTQLISNLLENSYRYTDAGGQVQIRLQVQHEQAVIDLEDSAPSVAPEDLPRLFERLYRVEGSRNRATGGAGLGLPLCQSIVLAHHGSIEARPSDLGGLWLRIMLPLRQLP